MQLGEPVMIGLPELEADSECPFSHDKPNPKEKNELGGIGQTLGKNMAAGTGVSKSKTPTGPDYLKGDEIKDPRDRPGSERIVAVEIKVNRKTVRLQGVPLKYPLTCAAHHLIPAQESLRDHRVLKFMCKHGEDQDFRKTGQPAPRPAAGSKVWGNVAYNVNGRQNGVWLPGNYAVGGGTGGIAVWKSRIAKRGQEANENWEDKLEDVDLDEDEWEGAEQPEEEEGATALAIALAAAEPKEYLLVGKNYEIKANNPKWGYVRAAMDATGGLFHDRHKDYSVVVKDYLDKVAEAYDEMHTRSKKDCKKCEEAARPDGVPANTFGPPYGIVARLVSCSSFFERYVKREGVKAKNIYTSKWVKAWIETKTGAY